MTDPQTTGLVAIDVGSSRIKLGWFPPPGECSTGKPATELPIATPLLPEPAATLAIDHRDLKVAALRQQLDNWLGECCPDAPRALLASVHPETAAKVEAAVELPLHRIALAEVPLEIGVDQPEQVGIDRLLNAVAVDRLRQPQRAAIVIDLGTAVTVDLISPAGVFEGGAILPGISLWASSLHAGTAGLPQLAPSDLQPPPEPVGKSTRSAIASGHYWGMVGAVSELAERMGRPFDAVPQVFLTGGDAERLAESITFLAQPARHVPHLVLAGMALLAEGRS